MSIKNTSFLAVSTLVGIAVGAGIFGLPYVVSRSGLGLALLYFLLLGGVVLLLHLFVGEIVLRTKEKHRLIGYARRYAGEWGSRFMKLATIGGGTGALLAYIILGANFLQQALEPFLEVSRTMSALVFWVVLSFLVSRGIRLIAKVEFILGILFLLVFAGLFVVALPHVELENYGGWNSEHIFLPFGIVLFALIGWSAVPEVAELFKNAKEKGRLDNVIVWGSAITILLSILFAVVVAGVSGAQTSPGALEGLVPFLGTPIVTLGALLGLLAVATSFLILGNYLESSLHYDLGFPLPASTMLAVGAPITLFLFGLDSFITVIALTGAFMGALEGSIIAFMFHKAKTKGDREPEYSLNVPRAVSYVLIAVLVGGGIAEIWCQTARGC